MAEENLAPPAPQAPNDDLAARIATLDVPAEPLPEAEAPAEQQAEAPPETPPEEAPAEETPAENKPKVEGDDVEEIEMSSLNQLAEHLDADPSDLYNLSIAVNRADGTTEDVTIEQIKDSYRAKQEYEGLRNTLGEERARYEAEQQSLQSEQSNFQNERIEFLKSFQQREMAKWQNVDWNGIREKDPGQYAALQADYQRDQAGFKHAIEETGNRIRQQAESAKMQMNEQQAELMARERQALEKSWPEYADPVKGDKLREQLTSYLRNQGYTQAELDRSFDHRAIITAKKAMLYDEGQKAVDVAKKKVFKLGKKPLGSGSRPGKAEQSRDALAKARAKAKKTGRMDDLADAMSLLE